MGEEWHWQRIETQERFVACFADRTSTNAFVGSSGATFG
jgi:hypothetical protein